MIASKLERNNPRKKFKGFSLLKNKEQKMLKPKKTKKPYLRVVEPKKAGKRATNNVREGDIGGLAPRKTPGVKAV